MSFQRAYSRPNEPPMPEPLAYFLTWTTYGTWLPGDERGWVLRGRGFQPPNPQLERRCRNRMKHRPCFLDLGQRELVESVVREHCRIRGWDLHAVRCGTNHVHVVVTAPCSSEVARDELKAWCSRRLNELQQTRHRPRREKWWTEKGSRRRIGDEESLEAVIHYVLFGQ
jgi:REP element-mobilizing transposase RayT